MKSVTVCSYGGCPRLTLKFDSLLHAFLSTRLYRHIRPFPRSCSPTSIPASGGQPRLMDLSLSPNPLLFQLAPPLPHPHPLYAVQQSPEGRAPDEGNHTRTGYVSGLNSTWRMQTRSVRDPVQQRWKAATAERRSEAGQSAERRIRNGEAGADRGAEERWMRWRRGGRNGARSQSRGIGGSGPGTAGSAR